MNELVVSTPRTEVVDALLKAQRALGSQTVLWSQALATRLGIHSTDVQAMDILGRRGPLGAGELAAETGLTTAAVTSLIDRLEARDFVRRVRDPLDRRRVSVEFNDAITIEEVMPLDADLTNAAAAMLDRYSEAEMVLIERFLRETREMLRRETERLRADAHAEPAG